MAGAYAYTPDIWPPLAAALFLTAIGLYSWRRRDVPGALPFAVGSLFGALVLLAMAVEAAAVLASTKVAWYRFQVIWQLPGTTCMTCFILEFTWPGRWLTRRNLTLLALPPLLVVFLVIFDDGQFMWHELAVAPDGAVVPYLTVVAAIVVGYVYGLGLVNVVALLWLFARSPQHHWPAALILFGMMAGRGFFLMDITHPPWHVGFDPVAAGYLVSWTSYAIALFGFHILDPLPAARTAAFEQMQEGMVIFDTHGRVASLNPAAASMLSISAAHARGKTLDELLPVFPDLCARLLAAGSPEASGAQEKTPYTTEISLGMGTNARIYVLDCSVLEDFRGLLVGHLLMLRDVTERRLAQAQALEQQQMLAVIHERERLAREMHDSLAQVLAFVNTQGQTVHRLLARGEIATADEHVERLVEAAREADTDIRESILGLRVSLTENGLSSALVTYLGQYEKRYAIHTELRRPETLDDGAFEPLVEVQLLRIIQEALTNARKHSHARSVRVTFASQDGAAEVTVQDDGCGFDPEQVYGDAAGRVGLRVMRERAEEVGGSLAVASAPGEGTRVVVRVPVRAKAGGATGRSPVQG